MLGAFYGCWIRIYSVLEFVELKTEYSMNKNDAEKLIMYYEIHKRKLNGNNPTKGADAQPLFLNFSRCQRRNVAHIKYSYTFVNWNK